MLVSMLELLQHAQKGNYGVTAPNVQSEPYVRAVVEVAEELKAPMIIDINTWVHPDIPWLVDFARTMAIKSSVPIAINLDHGRTYNDVILGIRSGFTSIMIDRSSLPYEENAAQTREAVKMCHELDISVEAELGHVGQGDNYDVDGVSNLTVPEEARKFVEETGCDCLAVAIGTAHGRYKGTPHIDFDRLAKIVKAIPNTPLVLHGGSGTGDENLQKAIHSGIQKVNLATELVTAGKDRLLEYLEENPNFDKWQLIPQFMEGYKEKLAHYVRLFDQENKAW